MLTSKQKGYTNHQPKKVFIFWQRNNGVKWKKNKVYRGIIFYSGWNFWVAIIISLLANIFFLLYCWHCLPSFTSLTFNLRLCLYSFAFFCSRLLQKFCICWFLVCNPVPSEAYSIFCFMSFLVCFFKKKKKTKQSNNLQVNHTKHKLWVSPEEGWDDQHRVGAPLLCRQAKRVGVVQAGEKKVLLRPYSIFQCLKGV